MEIEPNAPINYPDWFADWKKRIQSAQIKAALHVNSALLHLYWELGRDIVLKQETTVWGEGLILRFSKDLKTTFPNLTGFSPRNLFYIRKFYLFYQNEFQIEQQQVIQNTNQIVQQTAAQLYPFGNEQYAFFDLVPRGTIKWF